MSICINRNFFRNKFELSKYNIFIAWVSGVVYRIVCVYFNLFFISSKSILLLRDVILYC